jgi:hypothetical protein
MGHAHDYAAREHPEFVALDIGGDVGALIVRTDPALHGVEVEISPAGADGDRSHKQVLARSAGGQAEFTLVFDALAEGCYTLWLDGEAQAREVRVRGGAISELDWRGSAGGQGGSASPQVGRGRPHAGHGGPNHARHGAHNHAGHGGPDELPGAA